ncbi:hypothetical protein EV700_0116 [Fluviicoccus keumensis]|uniref:DUF2946 family protein n=1 Tax=Fluviicoccus keumensis TaxID=1435465 RepID=A0A4Q7ZBY2_9GAMM|nr:hypothetical protein [Fluviicoccus keumensis]RZU48142.1 hypothetical protein EV700_0116 [Fluviicoccus keumensis]HEX5277692.1 hypothetical protein [Fluviicoccus sp.]
MNQNRLTRKRLSVLLSLLLTAFLFCQGVAKAAALIPALSQVVVATVPLSCHERIQPLHTTTEADCDTGCQHLDKAYSPESQPSSWVHLPLVFIFFMPALQGEAGSPIAFASLPWHDPPGDPPIPIRFQRFLK